MSVTQCSIFFKDILFFYKSIRGYIDKFYRLLT